MKFSNGNKNFLSKLATISITVVITLAAVTLLNNGVLLLPQRGVDMDSALALGEVIECVKTRFYGDIPNDGQFISAAANGIVASLNDPYARYFTAEEYAEYRKTVSGVYSGVGVVVSVPDNTGSRILQVYEDSPASEAGIQADDILTHVNGESTANIDMDTLSQMLKDTNGAKLTLTILRNNQTLDFEVTPGTVNVKNVHYEIIDFTGYILIDMFSDNSPAEFSEALTALREKGITSLIIDLRDNPGGSLIAVLDIADELLSQGTIVSVGSSLSDKKLITYTANDGGINMPLAVLVNENSASASEILAAAVKENGIGMIIGKTTYGKGIVQTSMMLSTGDWLKLTTDAYFTPNGNNIQGIGVTPDITITSDMPGDGGTDPYIDTALEYVLSQES